MLRISPRGLLLDPGQRPSPVSPWDELPDQAQTGRGRGQRLDHAGFRRVLGQHGRGGCSAQERPLPGAGAEGVGVPPRGDEANVQSAKEGDETGGGLRGSEGSADVAVAVQG